MQDQELGPGIPEPPGGHNLPGGSFYLASSCRALLIGWALLSAVSPARGQTAEAQSAPQNSLQEHYDAAQNFQASGDLRKAAAEYRLFLAEGLHRLAISRAAIGDFAKAGPLFEEALSLSPADVDLRLDYAEACRRGNNLPKAKSLAEAAVKAAPKKSKARLVLGRILLQLNENKAAAVQLETAVAIEPNFANGFALANGYLKMKDEPHATRVFAEIVAGFGDLPEIHMDIGTAYAEAGYPEQAILEFKKVLAKNDKYPGAHYSLGAAYLVGMGDAANVMAAPEFREELKVNPEEVLSHYQLGTIALGQHKLQEAEEELTRAAALDPRGPDTFLSLGQLYVETNRPAEAEAALRKSIALTFDVSRNHFQVQRAHYLLARLLLQSGRQEEGKKEMQVSQELQKKSVLQNQGQAAGTPANETAGAIAGQDTLTSGPLDPEALKQVESFEQRVGPALADSYNNLGAMAAGGNNFAEALEDFQKAFQWNPALEGLDYNWGRAAFSADRYDQAVGPLGRLLQTDPGNSWVRSALGVSFFMLQKYGDALQTLRPIEALVEADPKLALVYAVCLVKTGDTNRGVQRLKDLATRDPGVALTHEALGEGLTSQGDFAGAAQEFRAALKLDSSDATAKYNLALALIELHQKPEAQDFLTEVVRLGTRNPEVYYQLGKLQLESGDTKAAIATLEIGAQVSPASESIHYELAAAYRSDSRVADADREMKLYETLRSGPPKAHDPAQPE
jgi:tetratricopeptide (TPR) repeat protein